MEKNRTKKHPGRYYALLASVGDYSKMNCAPLPTWKTDRDLMQNALTDGLKFDRDNIRCLGKEGFVSASEFARSIAGFSGMLQEEDLFLFYYSGHGKSNALIFSDMELGLQSILEVIEKIPARTRIVILDCCCSGGFSVSGAKKMTLEDTISAFNGRGIAVFAASAADEVSRLGPGSGHSLYTGFLCAAMQTSRLIRKGKISLPDIAGEVRFLMKTWSESHPDQSQQPVFRSSMGGTVYFSVADYRPYIPSDIFWKTEHYIVCSVKPLSTASVKRLAVFVIADSECTLADLPALTKEIAGTVKCAEIYSSEKGAVRFGRSLARAVWCYFGRDFTDIRRSNYFAYTIWAADKEMKQRYYRESRGTRITDGICLAENTSYEMVRALMQPELPRNEFICRTKQLLASIVSLSEEFITDMQEVENRTCTVRDIKEKYAGWIRKVRQQYCRIADTDVPPEDLLEWANQAETLAGCVLDLALLLEKDVGDKEAADREAAESFDQRQAWLVKYTVRRYYEALDKLGETQSKD